MDAAHLGSGNRICTVVFVDIVRYTEELVSKQVEMKAQFGALIATALEHTPAADGLFAANSLRAGVLDSPEAAGLRLRIGINLGPVRFVKDVNGQRNVIGDGINVAQRVMNFAEPNQILVSRSYYEVVSRLAPEYGQLFHYVGLHKDKHVREHEVYEVQLSPGARGETAPEAAAEVVGDPAGEGPSAPRFEPAFLARVVSALAREIGPVARLVVRKAAERAADARTLGEALALNVPEPNRRAFLAGLADVFGAEASGAARSSVTSPREVAEAKAPPGGGEIGAEVVARAEQILSRQIGPLARLLVREAAKHAKSPRDLFERLAIHIDDQAVRKLFLAEADR
jgi:adenylate/guanylate cyclase family protein